MLSRLSPRTIQRGPLWLRSLLRALSRFGANRSGARSGSGQASTSPASFSLVDAPHSAPATRPGSSSCSAPP
eukprot:6744149-Alexandrium_andersonii.AAC.1